MSSSSTNRRLPSAGQRPRAAATNRQEWVPRSSAPLHHYDQPQPRPSRRSATDNTSVPQLVYEIQDKLSRGTVECMICYDMVRRSAPMWSCPACYSIFHLHCVRKWARSPTSAADPTPTSSGDWRCPGCQSPQSIPAGQLSYTCFCGKRHDPPNDLYLTPHSCGEPCGKPLDRASLLPPDGSIKGVADREEDLRCPHVCVLQCHPGPCPPCKAFAPRETCPCGKTEIVRRCSERRVPLSCGQPCNRLLTCGRHHCERPCHAGSCDSCQELITASCFCGKKTEAVLCGDMAVKGEFNERIGLFSCNLHCGRSLSCGNHLCKENCHPGPCGECELLPAKIKACHCGKMSLVGERKSCLDPIPTCSDVCGKPLVCKTHFCKIPCHEGNCPPCSVLVEQRCRCGSSRQTVECHQLFDDKFSFICERTCGRKKNCGRHRCSERCCPLSKSGDDQISGGHWDPHFCPVPCGKRLRCGNHSCQLLCHSGHCPPCLETIFTDLSCACGKTTIPPPIPCGTPMPSCPHPCSMPQPCGHPASHSCHFGDCPPCTIPVLKECIGGHVMLRNIPCGSKDIRCNQLCGKTRQCGIHACARTCHPPPCDSSAASELEGKFSCGQVCGAPRRDCKHTCITPCHPSSACPERRCDFATTISCSCGRVTATVPCGAGSSSSSFSNDALFEASVIQKLPASLQPLDVNGRKVPLGQRKLACDAECEKAARKKQLADAFDVTQPNLDSLHFGESSGASEVLSDLMRREPKWVVAIEDRFKFMVLGKSKPGSGSNVKVHVFCHMVKEKRDAVRYIAERWKLSVQAAGWEPKRFVVVHVTPKSKPPARIIGSKSGVPVNSSQPPAYDPLIDMDPRLVVAMLDLPRDADISALVLRFGGECELVWLNDKNALSVFSDPVRAATALRRLEHGSPYQGAVTMMQTGGVSAATATGGNAWGGAAQSNSWKMAVAPQADSWGPDWSSGADLAIPVWKRNEENPISTTVNRWNMLDFDDAMTESASGRAGSSPADESLVDRGAVDVGVGHEVDNWEEVCE
ncbi:NF-X1-type zinc finger protein NFXL1 [Dendrobium catenatum]|uniref:NF-X1-type zinc finger protein NFXL1 n=1 Tax=Dendrobium catenatum TaxID=906689 RepID=A0A2I0WFE6_9ASPA|nr:NF-X1-type zinc finger protein NFXL1 [Dendrobium catenatum]PKU74377.1 NF-X1-type zinc finger protein NFXL1 [Dendrobium catenatum]